MEAEPVKSLERWRFELKTLGKNHWLTFYESFMGHASANPKLIHRARNLYGEWVLFESIVDSSTQKIEGDGTNYVVAVTRNKFKEQQKELDNESEYIKSIEESKKSTRAANTDLERKLSRRKKRKQ